MDQRAVFSLLAGALGQANSVIINKHLVRVMDGYDGAVFLSQLIYWSDRGRDGWFYKSAEEWQDEICLTRRHLDRATATLEAAGVLETKVVKVAGTPVKHYRLHPEILVDWLVKQLSATDGGAAGAPAGANGLVQNVQMDLYNRTNGLVQNVQMDLRETYKSMDLYKTYKSIVQIDTTNKDAATSPRAGACVAAPLDDAGGGASRPSATLLADADIPASSCDKHKKGAKEWHARAGAVLNDIIAAHGKVPSNTKAATRAEGFRLLDVVDKVPMTQVRQVLDWYKDHFADAYVPKAYSSQDFRDKWNKIVDAMGRQTRAGGTMPGCPAPATWDTDGNRRADFRHDAVSADYLPTTRYEWELFYKHWRGGVLDLDGGWPRFTPNNAERCDIYRLLNIPWGVLQDEVDADGARKCRAMSLQDVDARLRAEGRIK